MRTFDHSINTSRSRALATSDCWVLLARFESQSRRRQEGQATSKHHKSFPSTASGRAHQGQRQTRNFRTLIMHIAIDRFSCTCPAGLSDARVGSLSFWRAERPVKFLSGGQRRSVGRSVIHMRAREKCTKVVVRLGLILLAARYPRLKLRLPFLPANHFSFLQSHRHIHRFAFVIAPSFSPFRVESKLPVGECSESFIGLRGAGALSSKVGKLHRMR